MTPDCPREPEIVDAVTHARDLGDLLDHLAGCPVCTETAAIAAAIRDEGREALGDAHVPAAGTVWWRATIRARAEAAQKVSQPITLAQGIAAACAIGLACGLAGIAWQWVPDSLLLPYVLPLVVGLAACVLVAPLALYFALADD